MPKSPIPAAATGLPTSRRVFVRQLLAASALAAPIAAAAMAHAAAGDEPDAGFLTLDAEFSRLYAEYMPVLEETLRIENRFEEEAERQDIDPSRGRSDYSRWSRFRCDCGCEAAIKVVNEKAEIIDEISRRIRAIPAVGVAALAVKATALRFHILSDYDQVGYWNDESYDPDDWGAELIHRFVAEIRATAGLQALARGGDV